MITIHYSHCFDEGVYLEKGHEEQPSYNEVYVGPLGLLGLLERETGLTGDWPDRTERISRYSYALQKYLDDKPEAFYARAFSTDELAVAEDLLGWRDDLVLLGWKKLPAEGQPVRLKVLADVEALFGDRFFHYGLPDRWNDVLTTLTEGTVAGNLKVLVYDDSELSHPFFQKLFSALGDCIEYIDLNSGISIGDDNLGKVKRLLLGNKDIDKNLNPTTADRSFSIIQVPDNLLASDLLANLVRQGFDPVVINAENRVLDHYFVATGLPASGSTLDDSNPLIVQLFKLVAVGLTGPPDVYNLLSLLQSPYSPVPKKLAAALARNLIEKPGVHSPEWNEIIEGYFQDEEENQKSGKGTKDKRQQSELFLALNYSPDIDPVHAGEVFSSLKSWADKRSLLEIYAHSKEERDQFAYLSRLSEVFLQQIRTLENSVSSLRFLRLAESVYEPATFVNYRVQAGSMKRVPSPGSLLDNPSLVWWHDCYNTVFRARCHEFLCPSESAFLNESGVETWLPASQVSNAYEKTKRALLAAGQQCILVMSEKHNGSGTAIHPVIAEIRSFFANMKDITLPFDRIGEITGIPLCTSLSQEIKLPETKTYMEINNPERLIRRETESASSIEKLIQHPFEWVSKYQARFNSGNSFTLPEIFIIKGTVAHAVTRDILTGMSRDELSSLTDTFISERLDQTIMKEGLVFLLPQFRFELEDLRRNYKIAIRSLIIIIIENELDIVGAEMKKENEIPGFGKVAGAMDLVLKTKNGDQVIFDLKWALNNKKYLKKIEENKDLQLAVYYGLLGNNPGTAYFMFANGKLYTRHAFTGDNVVRITAPETLPESDVLEKICNSFNFRWEELSEGLIEIGDDVPIADLDYGVAVEEKNLVDLDESNGKKYGDRYSGLELFKGFIH